MRKKLLAMLLCVAMLLTLVPTMAFAGEAEDAVYKKVASGGFADGGKYLITTTAKDFTDFSQYTASSNKIKVKVGSTDQSYSSGSNGLYRWGGGSTYYYLKWDGSAFKEDDSKTGALKAMNSEGTVMTGGLSNNTKYYIASNDGKTVYNGTTFAAPSTITYAMTTSFTNSKGLAGVTVTVDDEKITNPDSSAAVWTASGTSGFTLRPNGSTSTSLYWDNSSMLKVMDDTKGTYSKWKMSGTKLYYDDSSDPYIIFDGTYFDRAKSGTAAAITLYRLIEKATVEPLPTVNSGLVYDGTAQQLIKTAGEATGGTMKFAVVKQVEGSSDAPATDAANTWCAYDADAIKQTAVGDYDVYYYIDADDYHKDSDVAKLGTVKITPKNISADLVYNKFTGGLAPGDYVIAYNTNSSNYAALTAKSANNGLETAVAGTVSNNVFTPSSGTPTVWHWDGSTLSYKVGTETYYLRYSSSRLTVGTDSYSWVSSGNYKFASAKSSSYYIRYNDGSFSLSNWNSGNTMSLFTADKPIAITGIDTPETGDDPDDDANVNNSSCTVESVDWCDDQDAAVTESFAYDTEYTVKVTLGPAANYKFNTTKNAYASAATVNGKDADSAEVDKDGNLVVSYTFGATTCDHTGLTKTDATSPTCTDDGVKAYWTCDVCGTKFSDAAGANEITDFDTWKSGDGQNGTATGHGSWSYDAEDDTITATCGNCSTYTEELTISAPTDDPLTYDGTTAFTATLNDVSDFESALSGADEDGITYTLGGVTDTSDCKDAGEYVATITVEGKSASVTYTVDKADQTLAGSDVTAAYGDTDEFVSVTGNEGTLSYAIKSGSATDVVSVDSSSGALTILKVGTATVTATAVATNNYEAATKDITVTITPKLIAVPTPVEDALRVYTGVEITGVEEDEGYTLTGNTGTNVDDYTAVATLVDKTNTAWDLDTPTAEDQEIAWSITTGEPTIATVTANNLTYNGDDQELVTATGEENCTMYYMIAATEPETTDLGWSTDIPTGKDAGTYMVWYYGEAVSDNFSDTEVDSETVTIGKATLTFTPEDVTILVNDEVPADYDYTVSGIADGEDESDVIDTEPTFGVDGNVDNTTTGSYTIEKLIGATLKSDNYEIGTYNTATLTVTNKTLQNLTADPITATYGENTYVIVDGNETALSYESNDTSVVTVNETTGAVTAVGVGSTTITASTEGDETYAPASVNVTVTVSPKALTIRADNLTAYVGDTAPDLTDAYEVIGLVGGDELTKAPTVAYETDPDMTQTGSVTILVSGAVADDNYTIEEYVNGTLTITTRPSSGGSKSTKTPTVTVPVNGEDDSVKVDATVSGSTATVKNIKTDDIDKVAGGEIEIDLSGLKKTINTVKLPEKTVEEIAENGNLSVKLTTAAVTFDDAATESIDEQTTTSGIQLKVETGKNSLSATQQEAVKSEEIDSQLVVSVSLVSGGKTISNFDGGKVTIKVPYTLKAGQNANGLCVYFIANDGTVEKIPCAYVNGEVVFTVEHFSDYVIAYDGNTCAMDLTCPLEKFSDLKNDGWYHDGIHFCLANGIMNGVAETAFGPNQATTRGMIVTMLARLSGADTTANGGKWYLPGQEWAVANGISDGSAMTANITREQLAEMLYRYALEIAKVDVDKFTADTNTLSYEDVFTISEWANAGVHFCLASGVIGGYEDGTIRPQANATRAEVATMFMRFCEIVLGK